MTVFVTRPVSRTIFLSRDDGTTVTVTRPVTRTLFSNTGVQGPAGPSGGQAPWIDLTADATLVTGNRYRANSTVRLNLTLPASNFGDPDIVIQGFGTGGWKAIGAGFLSGSSNSFISYVESAEQYDYATFSPMGSGLWAVYSSGFLQYV